MHIEIDINELRTNIYDITDDINIAIGSLWFNGRHQVGKFTEYMCRKWPRSA